MFRNSEIQQQNSRGSQNFRRGDENIRDATCISDAVFLSTSSYQILAKTPLIGQYEKSWKGNLNLPSEGRLLQNPSQLGEATQLVKKLNELADYGIQSILILKRK